MKKITPIFFLFTCIIMSSCNPKKENQTAWRKLQCGLYINSEGKIAFPSDAELAESPSLTTGTERCKNVFITHVGTDQKQSINSVVDTNSFASLGANYYQDRSNIYSYHPMCDGGYLYIFSNDTATFRVLGDCYASHKLQIFHFQKGLVDADFATFETSKNLGQLAKDKNGFFSFGDRIAEEKLKSEIDEKLLNQLKSL